MNYGKTEVSRKLRRISSKAEKLTSRMIFLFVKPTGIFGEKNINKV